MVYLDYAATTPMDARVRESFMDAVDRLPGNPSSSHAAGAAAASAVSVARGQVASLLLRTPSDVVFTGGASEALALGILGICLTLPASRRGVLIGATEHKAAFSAVKFAERLCRLNVRSIPADEHGLPRTGVLSELLGGDTGLVITMLANNEIGALSPLEHVVDLAHQAGAVVMCDITQAVGKTPMDLDSLGADLLALSAHKFYGPKGTGALITDREVRRRLVSPFAGGGQEGGLRGGTHNVPGIVGMGAAAELAQAETGTDRVRLADLAVLTWSLLAARVPDVRRLGLAGHRIESVISVQVPGTDAEEILDALQHTEISAGSACNAGNPEPSHVLTAMGLSADEASQCLRISLGRMTTERDIRAAAQDIAQAIDLVRGRHRWEAR